MDAIKKSPESELSFQEGTYDFLLGKYTSITSHDPQIAVLIRRDTTRFIDQVAQTLESAIFETISNQLGPCEGTLF